jgi:hypothetical protein
MKQAHMESLDKLGSVFLEQKHVRSLCHQLHTEVKMVHRMEQNVDFCVKLKISPNETLQMIRTVHGESTGKRSHGCQV